ncbi:MAG: hypothetical protein HQ513_13340 [Rhodospirillales bacterium]|nr:hypothetical protein [Rhodospirillales bacterium]
MLNKIAIVVGLCVFTLNMTTAQAAGAGDKPLIVTDKITQTECGDCHMVFPPGRLTGAGWAKIMDNLGDHFGEDASISAKNVKHIKAYLLSKSLDGKNSYPSKLVVKQWAKKGVVDPMRITETPNWIHAHKSQKYKLMVKEVGYTRGANCIKCHKNAERGTYEEFPGLYGLN